MNIFTVTVMGREKTLFDGEAVSLTVKAGLGWMNVWAHHAPYLTTIAPGKIFVRISADAAPVVIASTGTGILEVARNQATLFLSDTP
jgi:F0F1-type ATP synthase epsilon subunit